MKDLKIRVANEAESKEAQELFDALGYSKDAFENKSTPCWIAICDGFTYSDYNIGKSVWYTACPKQITLQELRDMVNPMKEYLEKQADGSYKLVMRGIVGKVGDIEVPEGENVAYKDHDSGAVYFTSLEMGYRDVEIIWKRHTQPEELPFIDDEPTLDKVKIKINGDLNQAVKIAKDMGYYNCQFDKIPQNAYWLLCNESGSVDYSMNENILNEYAMLHIEDESESLNDQYAEIEQVRKHRHYFKDVSNIAEIDIYTVLKLFEVTDPCLQHIVKKALCAGKRGHKDMMEDLQNIVDTAIRAVELNS